jgi:diphthine-ammonia ligase
MGLFLSSMSLFSEVNAVYAQYFGTSPPARATVAVSLPDGINIRLECVAFKESEATRKQALHVQGLSYWAPANIGPYSQAIFVSHILRLCGTH